MTKRHCPTIKNGRFFFSLNFFLFFFPCLQNQSFELVELRCSFNGRNLLQCEVNGYYVVILCDNGEDLSLYYDFTAMVTWWLAENSSWLRFFSSYLSLCTLQLPFYLFFSVIQPRRFKVIDPHNGASYNPPSVHWDHRDGWHGKDVRSTIESSRLEVNPLCWGSQSLLQLLVVLMIHGKS